MPSQTNKVLVTGALGWLGISLVEALIKGLPEHDALKEPRGDLKIRCLILPGQDGSQLKKISNRIEVVAGDIRNAADCTRLCQDSKGALLFHTAGIIHPKKVAEFFQINVDGTSRLLDAAIQAGVKRAVVVSSNSPCGCNPHPDHLFDEQSPYHPYMNYGRSKMRMELAIKDRQSKIETVIIRPPWFYGPNQPPRQTLFFGMVRDGKAPIVGSGQNMRSMGYIENLCQGLLLAALVEKASGRIYWIADKKPYSMNEIIDTIERLLENEFGQKCAHKRMRLPGIASEVALVADASLQALGLYHQKIHVLSEMNKTIACSVARAEAELGYRPTVALEEGMRRSMAWCMKQGIKI
ncbi:MAG: NAD-dependent epimerase/dehydratase [Pedosphaera sp.]|nr:NAD-dependent epimerase/dehydratase [Pedosphaera sp.]